MNENEARNKMMMNYFIIPEKVCSDLLKGRKLILDR